MTKHKQEAALFEEDVAAMLALPERPFRCVEYVRRRADKKGRVHVGGRHWYSTGPEWAGQELVVGLWAARVTIADREGSAICEHPRAYGDAPRMIALTWISPDRPASPADPANGLAPSAPT